MNQLNFRIIDKLNGVVFPFRLFADHFEPMNMNMRLNGKVLPQLRQVLVSERFRGDLPDFNFQRHKDYEIQLPLNTGGARIENNVHVYEYDLIEDVVAETKYVAVKIEDEVLLTLGYMDNEKFVHTVISGNLDNGRKYRVVGNIFENGVPKE